uniref:Uncharacterized protein n=1 Tax=Arundo donax TaxID=35708 RepID=A0A0A9EEQ5_ARUDO
MLAPFKLKVIQNNATIVVKAKKEQVLPLSAMSMLFTEHNTKVPIQNTILSITSQSSAGKASETPLLKLKLDDDSPADTAALLA